MSTCSSLQLSSGGLANIASGWLTITANIRAGHWFSVMGTFLPFEIITYAI
jgi:hypothetical protein